MIGSLADTEEKRGRVLALLETWKDIFCNDNLKSCRKADLG